MDSPGGHSDERIYKVARINIEDSLYQEQGWFDLLIATKSADTALGALVRAFTVAQKYWVPEKPKGMAVEQWLQNCRKGIPLSEWKKQRLNDAIIEVGLAKLKDDAVFVAGSEKQFQWLFTKYENGNKGGRPKNPKNPGGSEPENKKPGGSKNLENKTGSNPLTPTPTPTLNTTTIKENAHFDLIPEFKEFESDKDVGPYIRSMHTETQQSILDTYKDPKAILKQLKQMVCDFRERKESLDGEFGLKAVRWLKRQDSWDKQKQHPTINFHNRFKTSSQTSEFDDDELQKIKEGK